MTHIEQELRRSRTFRQAVGKHTVLSIPYTRRRLWTYLAMRMVLIWTFFKFNSMIGYNSGPPPFSTIELTSLMGTVFLRDELTPLLMGTVFLLMSLISFVCALITHFHIHSFLENVTIQAHLMELMEPDGAVSDNQQQ